MKLDVQLYTTVKFNKFPVKFNTFVIPIQLGVKFNTFVIPIQLYTIHGRLLNLTMNKTEAIKNFLNVVTHSDLANLYNFNMEVQLIVGQDGGTRVDGDYKGKQYQAWTDGFQTWKPIRIPWNANSEPIYEESKISFDIAQHALGIGMTGWDWVNKQSKWVAFDFDAITGHSEKHSKKLSDEELKAIELNLKDIEWVTLRKSTGGRGLHLYVFTPDVPTENHTVHAALAKAILAKLSGIVGYDFIAKVDTCGSNMWVWHRKMQGTDGLTLLKQGRTLNLTEVPPNWRDYQGLISGKKKRIRPSFINGEELESTFDELVSQYTRVQLDNEHKRIIEYLTTNYPSAAWWDADNHILVTHTYILQETHQNLNLKGIFKTIALGEEKGTDINCWAVPIQKGGWIVRRYSPGVVEDISWEQDGTNWTKCYYNALPTINSVCKFFEGLEDEKKTFHFKSAKEAVKAAKTLGVTVELPDWVQDRIAKLKQSKDGRLILQIEAEDKRPLPGFLLERKHYTKVFGIKLQVPEEETDINLDEELRHVVSENGEDYGWLLKFQSAWNDEPYIHIKEYLKSKGYKTNEISVILGKCVSAPWRLVNVPFEEEYLSDRRWNRNAAKIKYIPSSNRDNLSYPTWLKILNHCGRGLDNAIQNNDWCKNNLILTGADYLKVWIAFLLRRPFEPLPYLFFYGPQDSGKSIFHESIKLLMSTGTVRADLALINPSGFNGELANAVLCVVEETDLRTNKQAGNRIKDWVTSIDLTIHKKSKTPNTIANTTHWVQTANSHLFCPIFPGDTRITMVKVDSLTEKIPKREIIPLLEKEAPDFLRELMDIELPLSLDRLGIPIIVTEEKQEAERANQTLLEMYVDEFCFHVPGEMVKFTDFYAKFIEWLDPNYHHEWPRNRVSREFPPTFCKGNCPSTNYVLIGNFSWNKPAEDFKPICHWVVRNGKMYKEYFDETDTKESESEQPKLVENP